MAREKTLSNKFAFLEKYHLLIKELAKRNMLKLERERERERAFISLDAKHDIWNQSETMFSCIVCVFSNNFVSPFYFMNIATERECGL